MEIWPSLDLMGGKVVRLVKGNPSKSIVYSDDPLKVALKWQRARVSGLHIIDLDATLQLGNNIEVIQKIVKNIDLPTQLGGGIRSIRSIEAAFKLGVEKVIVGTALFTNKLDPIELLKFGSNKVVIAIDHINGQIAISGWRTKLSLKLSSSIQKLWNQGFRLFLSTSASRDGTLKGCDKSHLMKIEKFLPYTYIAGGISSLEDLRFLKNKNVKGAILGRALYDSVIKIEEVMEVAGLAKS
ncbi:MAG: 1-(5-phosphoribosyl)-5-[(5-phosphoribosylamino)methylideneamino] imidazole-4-carboxamide isomerase [Nitrososphaeria archaeon]